MSGSALEDVRRTRDHRGRAAAIHRPALEAEPKLSHRLVSGYCHRNPLTRSDSADAATCWIHTGEVSAHISLTVGAERGELSPSALHLTSHNWEMGSHTMKPRPTLVALLFILATSVINAA